MDMHDIYSDSCWLDRIVQSVFHCSLAEAREDPWASPVLDNCRVEKQTDTIATLKQASVESAAAAASSGGKWASSAEVFASSKKRGTQQQDFRDVA